MTASSTITYRNMSKIERLDADIRRRIDKLVRFGPSLNTVDVIVEQVARHRQSGRPYRVRIEISLPGGRIVVAHVPETRHLLRQRAARSVRKQDEPDRMRKDQGVAVRDAFAAATRRLQDYVRRQRGAVKAHPRTPARPVRRSMAAR